MKLTVQLFAVLRERAGTSELVLADLPDELDVAGLKRELERRHPELGSLDHVRGVVGTEYVPDATPVQPGAAVSFLPPVSGGAPGSTDVLVDGVFELCPEALDPAVCQRRVEHPSCGAVATFCGLTRETNRGQRVVRLQYEAFEAMTGPEMGRIFAACRREHGDSETQRLRMLCQHRVGVVEVGQPSVVIAVASPHRDAAFKACRFLIDELKQSLPIWKKEVYEDGHHWIGDRS